MGKCYYLSKGYNIDDYKNVELTEIFGNIKSIEDIDMYTSKFNNYNELKNELLRRNLIKVGQEIVIGCYKTNKKTKEKKLVPIFNKRLLFKDDFKLLGFNGNNYNELAEKIKEFIFSNANDLEFVEYFLNIYREKYLTKPTAPIRKSGSLKTLRRMINIKKMEDELYDKLFIVFENDLVTKRKINKVFSDIIDYETKIKGYEDLHFLLNFSSIDETIKSNLITKLNTLSCYSNLTDVKSYSIAFRNLFINEIYKCDLVEKEFIIDGYKLQKKVFVPIENKLNYKGLHDLIIFIINLKEEEKEFEQQLKDVYEEMEINSFKSSFTGNRIIQDCEREEYEENLERYIKEKCL